MIETNFKHTEIGLIPHDWEVKSLGDIGEIRMCKRIMKYQTSQMGDIPFFKIGTFGKEADAYISRALFEEFRRLYNYPQKGDILLSAAGTIGRTVVFDGKDSYFQDSNIVWLENKEKILRNSLLYYIYQTIKWVTDTGTIPRIYNDVVRKIFIAFPPTTAEQERIADALSKIDSLIVGLDELLEKKRAIKTGTMQQLLTGKKRLKGFTGEWDEVELGEVLDYEQPTKYIVSSTEYTTDGIPVLTAGKTFILGYTHEDKGIYDNTPVIIFDDFVTESKYVDFPFKVKSSAIKMLQLKDKSNNLRLVYEMMKMIDFPVADHKRWWISQYSKNVIKLPKPAEQNAIASILSSMDTEISALEQKRDKYIAIKQGMMQQLLTGKIRLV